MTAAGKSKEIRDILKQIEAFGKELKYQVVMDGKGHWKILRPEERPLTICATPSDVRSVRNIKAYLRRNGIPIKR